MVEKSLKLEKIIKANIGYKLIINTKDKILYEGV